MKKIGFLGFGNMATAIAKGMLSGGIAAPEQIYAFDPIAENITSFHPNTVLSESPLQLAGVVDYLFLCVKPQMIDEALKSAAGGLSGDTVVISIAAGVTVEKIKKLINRICPVIRVMPNTPLLLGSGTTAMAKPDDVSEADYDFVRHIFESVGSVYEIDPGRFNEVTALNGTAPALIYLFAKVMADTGKSSGLDYGDSLRMFADTLIGSARMIRESGIEIETLIKMVCSRGGTTLAALDKLREYRFEEAIENAYRSCTKRAYELGEQA